MHDLRNMKCQNLSFFSAANICTSLPSRQIYLCKSHGSITLVVGMLGLLDLYYWIGNFWECWLHCLSEYDLQLTQNVTHTILEAVWSHGEGGVTTTCCIAFATQLSHSLSTQKYVRLDFNWILFSQPIIYIISMTKFVVYLWSWRP